MNPSTIVALHTQLKEQGLTFLQLVALLGVGGSVTDLAAFMGTSLSCASGLVERLVQMGLVKREAGKKDRRVQVLGLTENGQAKLKALLHPDTP